MPVPSWVPMVERSGATTIRALVEAAHVAFSGDVPLSERLVVIRCDQHLPPGELGPLLCEPASNGVASITLSGSLSSIDCARQALAVLAYALFDPAARHAVRGQPWSRPG